MELDSMKSLHSLSRLDMRCSFQVLNSSKFSCDLICHDLPESRCLIPGLMRIRKP